MTKCFIPIFGRRIRVTRLDDCGNVPSAGTPDAFVATDGFVSITLTSEIEEGNEILRRKADGTFCVNELGDPFFKRFTVEMSFCDVNPDLLAIMTNAEAYEDYDLEAAGIVVPEGSISKRFALELWTGLSNEACSGTETAGGYLLLPFVAAGVLGDLEINGEDAIDFSMTGAFTKGGNNWGVGPYDVLLDGVTPSPLPSALDPLDHLLLVRTGVAPPASACAAQPMPA